jgi:hypothetical protein
MALFERGGQRRRGAVDNKGKVRLKAYLVDQSGKRIKGNIGRSCTVHDAKVSGVIKAVEEALFGEPEEEV